MFLPGPVTKPFFFDSNYFLDVSERVSSYHNVHQSYQRRGAEAQLKHGDTVYVY